MSARVPEHGGRVPRDRPDARPPTPRPELLRSATAARWLTGFAACSTNDIEPEDVIGFDHDGEAYAIYRSPDDEFFATAGHCTHQNELLCDGLVMGTLIECPKHNGRFDYRTGTAKGAPVVVDLRTYPTRVEAGTVFIDVS